MSNLKLSHIYKVYPNGTKAVNDFTMDIEDKEFIVFVGPSGCGKSTTLRMIAGLEEISAGELRIGEAVVNNVEPKDRDIAMVFQNYALYPHMTVYDNMAFGLRIRKISDTKRDENGNPVLGKDGEPVKIMRHYTKQEIDDKVNSAAEILGITEYLQKKPKEMSGGQRQRVALGRAIVREPKVFLLDEPLSNLDAKLRTSMRSEISKLHKKLQTTFIYVTHDQIEAMTMGTRIVVMKDGFIQQIDTPKNLYRYPCNKFVAGFIGAPQMNFYAGTLKREGNQVRIKLDNTEVDMLAPYDYFAKANAKYLTGEKKVILGIRPEHISFDRNAYPYVAKCRVSHVEELGIDSQIYGDLCLDENVSIIESATKIIVKAPADVEIESGDIIEISCDLRHLHIFDADTEYTVCPRIPEFAEVSCSVKSGKLNLFGASVQLPAAIAIEDGEYHIVIPTDAIKSGATYNAKYISEENVNGQRLVRLDLNGMAVFVKAQPDEKFAGVDIDLKLCAFEKNGEQIVAPMPTENALTGKIVNEARLVNEGEKKAKFLSKRDYDYFYEICGHKIAFSLEKAKLIYTGLGKKIFSDYISFRFNPYSVKVADKGIPAKVLKILDYGKETFAMLEVVLPPIKKKTVNEAGKKITVESSEAVNVYMSVEKDFAGTDVYLDLDPDEISVYTTENNIRLV